MRVIHVRTVCLLATSVAVGSSQALTLATKGKAPTDIILCAEATAAERTAAEELASYLAKVTGADFAVVEEGDRTPRQRGIFVGPTQFSTEHVEGLSEFGREEWLIRTVSEDSLVLAGGRPRGTLYAVYHFLEDIIGVRWWSPWEEAVPSNSELQVDELDQRGKPAFAYRDIYMLYGNDDGRFAARNRLNRDGDRRIAGKYGGCMDYGPPYHVHTFYLYVPPKQYFASNPEFFSLSNGVRCAERHQLCLTNPQLRELMVSKFVQYITTSRAAAEEEGRPPPRVFSISQNDWGGACQCDDCQRIAKAEGSEVGTLLDFLNHISDAVRSTYPDIFISTLAYQYTQEPPHTIKPRDNIIIRLCDTTSNFAHAITSPDNQRFHDILLSWSKVARNLRIWDYAVTYAAPRGLPFPSARTYQADYQFYAEHNVEGVFTEHEYPVISDSRDLKVWLMIKLLEDPYQDDQRLLRDFTDGFYGAAGSVVREYLALLGNACDAKGSHISMGTSATGFGYLDAGSVTAAQSLFDEAERRVAADPVRLRRVRHARLSLDRATIVSFKRLVGTWRAQGERPDTFPLDRDAVAARCRSTWDEQIDLRIPESGRSAEKRKATEELAKYTSLPVFVPLPEKFRAIPATSVYDFTADQTRNWRDIVKVVKDSEATAGITNRLQFPTETVRDKHPVEKYKLPMPWGLYAPATTTFVTSSKIESSDVPGPGYHWYRMGPHKIGRSYYLYFFWSWIIQLDIDSVVNPGEPDAEFDIWARIKFEGPAFPHGRAEDKNAICVERVVLVKSEGGGN